MLSSPEATEFVKLAETTCFGLIISNIEILNRICHLEILKVAQSSNRQKTEREARSDKRTGPAGLKS
jgi:hypothetical protein